jgi:hypothetical protein
MNGAGQWRCSLDWMSIHTVMTTSSITHNRLRQGTRGKRISTFSSRHSVSAFRVCENIFKSCLPTPMTRPSDSIIFTKNFTLSVNLFCQYIRVLIFFKYTRAFCLDLFGFMMFPNNSADSVSEDSFDWG